MIGNNKFLIALVFFSLFIQYDASAEECFIVWNTTTIEYSGGLDSCEEFSPRSGVSITSETAINQQSAYTLYQDLFPYSPEPTWYEYTSNPSDCFYYYGYGRGGAGAAFSYSMQVFLDGSWRQDDYYEIRVFEEDSCYSLIEGTWDVVCDAPPRTHLGSVFGSRHVAGIAHVAGKPDVS